MFTNSLLAAVFIGLSFSEVLASPIVYKAGLVRRTQPGQKTVNAPQSFNNWSGIQTMGNFDNFFGQNNFNQDKQTIIIKDKTVVCKSQQVRIIQQKLAIIQEMAKRILTEQICEVEVQTIVLQQFRSGMESFGNDISRKSSRAVAYDRNIASKFGQIVDSNGNLNLGDLGFDGSSVGQDGVNVQGSNWNDNTSPAKVQAAKEAAKLASGKNETKNDSNNNSNSKDNNSSNNDSAALATCEAQLKDLQNKGNSTSNESKSSSESKSSTSAAKNSTSSEASKLSTSSVAKPTSSLSASKPSSSSSSSSAESKTTPAPTASNKA